MKAYQGYLLDLDGTMYRGSEALPEAVAFVKQLQAKNIPYLFVTNNSTSSPKQVAERLKNMGVPCDETHVLTTSMAAASYASSQPVKQSAYVIGESGLKQSITSAGIIEEEEAPGFVIIGLDRQVTYDKLAKACHAVRNGAQFISTNRDAALPTEKGFYPGNGAITSVVTVATGKQPMYIGKPERMMIDQAKEIVGISPEEMVFVGDNYDTDILAGIRAGIDTIHVNTGVTRKEEVVEKEILPTYSLDTLADWDIF